MKALLPFLVKKRWYNSLTGVCFLQFKTQSVLKKEFKMQLYIKISFMHMHTMIHDKYLYKNGSRIRNR